MKDDVRQLFLDCVHCGLCLSACPTYQELGTEMDSPRGRIYLMRALSEGRLGPDADTLRHLDLCLGCRACEPACPSGVQYGRLLEASRADLEPHRRPSVATTLVKHVLSEGVFPYPGRMRLAMGAASLSRWMSPWLPPALRTVLQLVPQDVPGPIALPHVTPAKGARRYRVAFLTGCAGSVLFPQVNAATVSVLARSGCEVVVPPGQGCCGAIHVHNGGDPRPLAEANVRAFEAAGPFDAIITNAAGCGSTLKEYGHLDAAWQPFAGQVRDVSEWLVSIGFETPPPLPVTVTYQDACHLAHAQRIRKAPRQLLEAIPGLKLVEMAESDTCCGGAGIYNMLQPDMSERLLRRKVDAILATGASLLAAGNPGCLMQIRRGLGDRVECVHPVELLDRAWRNVNNR